MLPEKLVLVTLLAGVHFRTHITLPGEKKVIQKCTDETNENFCDIQTMYISKANFDLILMINAETLAQFCTNRNKNRVIKKPILTDFK